jgi:hypothetical protein
MVGKSDPLWEQERSCFKKRGLFLCTHTVKDEGEGKGKLVHMHSVTAYWVVEVYIHSFLAFAQDGGE